jgi:hypothetical protein
MTLWRISLSKLRECGKVELTSGFDDPFEYVMVTLTYRLINGIPFYEAIFIDCDKYDLSSTNAVAIIAGIVEEYSNVVMIP